MAMKKIWDKLDALKIHPELAETPGYELEQLREQADAVDWFFLLMQQPQFAPPEAWWFELRRRCDLPWAKLLAAQPQFAQYCHWESVNRLELSLLGYLAPELFQRQFPQGRPWDLYAFLTPLEKMFLLRSVPQLENSVDWEELAAQWHDGLWLMLLEEQPQFEKYFDWARIEGKPSPYWADLLRKQPQFAGHCDWSKLEPCQVRRILKRQPQLAALQTGKTVQL